MKKIVIQTTLIAFTSLSTLPAIAQTNNPIAPAEMAMAPMGQKIKGKLKQADTNNDGKWSMEEVSNMKHLQKNFTTIDTNKDGFLVPEELKAFGDNKKAQLKARFDSIDVNKDGQFSKEEVANKKKLAEHFDMIDADKNGQLSKDELKNHHKNKSQNQSQNKN